jgi:GNAT superfamily N-acetyltransferase
VRVATEADQANIDRETHAVWGAGLTEEQYIEREANRRRYNTAAVMTRTQWVLYSEADPTDVLTSIESFCYDSLTCGELGHTHCFASVFTAPRHRGKGFCPHLLVSVAKQIAEADPLAQAALLYSDIGGYYTRCGFVADHDTPTDIVLPPLAQPLTPGILTLSAEEAGAVLDGVWSGLCAAGGKELSVRVVGDKLRLLMARERAYPGRCPGAFFYGVHKSGCQVAVVWVLHDNELHAAFFTPPGEVAAPLLLTELALAARSVAHTFGQSCVRIWTPHVPAAPVPPELAAAGGVRQVRGHALPMVLPLRPGLSLGHWTNGITALHWV